MPKITAKTNKTRVYEHLTLNIEDLPKGWPAYGWGAYHLTVTSGMKIEPELDGKGRMTGLKLRLRRYLPKKVLDTSPVPDKIVNGMLLEGKRKKKRDRSKLRIEHFWDSGIGVRQGCVNVYISINDPDAEEQEYSAESYINVSRKYLDREAGYWREETICEQYTLPGIRLGIDSIAIQRLGIAALRFIYDDVKNRKPINDRLVYMSENMNADFVAPGDTTWYGLSDPKGVPGFQPA